MRADQCSVCGHFLPTESWCSHSKKPIRKIKGCSCSPSGKMFFRAKRAKEAIRLRVTGHKKETEK